MNRGLPHGKGVPPGSQGFDGGPEGASNPVWRTASVGGGVSGGR